jgi:hypothetical protein
MSENTTSRNVSNDEIDLMDLFSRMGRTLNRWGRSSGRAFLISVVFIAKRWLPLGLSIVAGIGVAFFLKSTSHSIYTSDMVFRSNVIENSQMISYINILQTLDKQSLSSTLDIPRESSDNIQSIEAFWIIDLNKDKDPDHVDYRNNHNIYDTTNIRMQDRFDIRVTINSPQELNRVRDGLIRYVDNNPQFQLRNKIRLEQNQELIERLNLDIKQLDSLQKVKYFEETRKRNSQSGGQIVFMQEQNTQLLYKDIYSLYARKQAMESEKDMYKGIVTVLSDFSIPTSRVNGLIFYTKQIVPDFFLAMLLILILLANKEKIKEIYGKY